MRRVAVLAGFLVWLSSCASMPVPEATAPASDGLPVPVEPDEPPPMLINGVAGRPVTWCWRASCVDGFVNSPDILPAVNPPFEVVLPPGGRIEAVEAIGPLAAGADLLTVPHQGTEIGEVPEGAVMLNIFIRFDQGGDASYYWALNRPAD